MNAPMSALAHYLFYIVDETYKKQFLEQIYNHRDTQQYFNQKDTGFAETTTDYTKDGTGKAITKEHPLHELSNIISKFKLGERAEIKEKDSEKIKAYFKEQGPHFCAGYLSRYNKVAYSHTDDRLFPNLSDYISSLIHRKSYNAAYDVYLEHKFKDKYPNISAIVKEL